MKPERWQKIRRICEDALERKAGDRDAYLRNACAGDDQLRTEVDSFLSGAVGKDGFIETPAIEIAAKGMAKDEVRERSAGSEWRDFPPLSNHRKDRRRRNGRGLPRAR